MGKANPEYANYLADVLAPLGPIHWRAMFGGYGVYCGDLFFALAVDDVLYLKADAETRERFEQAGLPPFTYLKQGQKSVSVSYYQAPDEIFDDEEALRLWGNLALAAALRARKKPAVKKVAAAAKKPAARAAGKVAATPVEKKPAGRKKASPA